MAVLSNHGTVRQREEEERERIARASGVKDWEAYLELLDHE